MNREHPADDTDATDTDALVKQAFDAIVAVTGYHRAPYIAANAPELTPTQVGRALGKFERNGTDGWRVSKWSESTPYVWRIERTDATDADTDMPPQFTRGDLVDEIGELVGFSTAYDRKNGWERWRVGELRQIYSALAEGIDDTVPVDELPNMQAVNHAIAQLVLAECERKGAWSKATLQVVRDELVTSTATGIASPCETCGTFTENPDYCSIPCLNEGKRKPVNKHAAIEAYERGLSISQIAALDEIGASETTVRDRLVEWGVHEPPSRLPDRLRKMAAERRRAMHGEDAPAGDDSWEGYYGIPADEKTDASGNPVEAADGD